MPSTKVEFRSHGNEAKSPDFKMELKKLDKKMIRTLPPETKRSLNQYLQKCEHVLQTYKKDIQREMEE